MLRTRTPYLFLCLLFAVVARPQWQHVGPTGPAYGIVHQGGALYLGILNGGLHRSTDHGDTWTSIDAGITNGTNWWLASVEDVLYCGTQFGPAFRSTDEGASWEDIGLSGARGFVMHHDTLYACEWYAARVSWSVDQGTTWTATEQPDNISGVWPLYTNGEHLFVGGQNGGVYRIAHSSGPWEQVNEGLPHNAVHSIGAIGDILIAGTVYDGVHRSMDAGASWLPSDLAGTNIYALHAMDGRLFAGTAGNGIFTSSDSGATWTPLNEGLTNAQVARITSDDSYLYAGTLGGGLFRFDRDQITAVREAGTTQVARLHPNPCADRCTLQLELPAGGEVSLTVFDATGAVRSAPKVLRLPPGSRALTLDTRDLAPGTYIVRLSAGGGGSVARLMVMR